MMVGPWPPFHLGLVAVLCAVLAAAGLARPLDRHRYDVPGGSHGDDGTARSERSTNLSHITGTARKIQMYVKNRHLQILPDGTVNGTADDLSAGGVDYTILQRSSVHTGQLKIQSVATCLFLCMDSCGLLYGSREFTEDCIFNEMIEQHHYNTYSSARYSNDKRTLYLALNKRGQPRKVQVRKGASLGKLSAYTKVLTRTVPSEHVESLVAALLRDRGPSSALPQHPVRHHGYHQLCPQPPPPPATASTSEEGRDKFRCRRRKKRKKKRRRCRDGEQEGEQCQRRPGAATAASPIRKKDRRRCADSDDQQECLRRLQAARKRRKGGKKAAATDPDGPKKKKKAAKKGKAKRRRQQKRPKVANNGGGKLEQAEAAEENQRELTMSSSTTTEDSWWGGDATAGTPSATEEASPATEEDVDYPSPSPSPAPD